MLFCVDGCRYASFKLVTLAIQLTDKLDLDLRHVFAVASPKTKHTRWILCQSVLLELALFQAILFDLWLIHVALVSKETDLSIAAYLHLLLENLKLQRKLLSIGVQRFSEHARNGVLAIRISSVEPKEIFLSVNFSLSEIKPLGCLFKVSLVWMDPGPPKDIVVKVFPQINFLARSYRH